MGKHAVFLDRDGTINIDPGYPGNPASIVLYPGVSSGISELKNKYHFKIIVISNQSGIARGLLTENQVNAVNLRINEILSEAEAQIDAFYYCPHHPDFSNPSECGCRKPSPEMVFKAASELNIDLSLSYFVGDSVADIECGLNAGLKTVLVSREKTGEKINLLKKAGKSPNFIAKNFQDACRYVQLDFQEKIII